MDLLGLFKDLGAYWGLTGGLLYDALGPRWTLACGAAQHLLGYLAVYAILVGSPALGGVFGPRAPPVGSTAAILAFAANGNSLFDTAALLCAMEAFPNERGVVSGLMKAYLGLSSAIFAQVYAAAVPDLALFPRQIMEWTGTLYGGRPHGVFADMPGWQLRENDYVIGERKVGGNAQSISKDRWLHHTSFLWDFREETMKYLTNPAKQPRYRANRSHSDFLAPLKTYLPDRNALATRIEAALEGMGLEVAPASIEQAEDAVAAHHRGSGVGTTGVVDLETALTLGPDDRAPMLTGA